MLFDNCTSSDYTDETLSVSSVDVVIISSSDTDDDETIDTTDDETYQPKPTIIKKAKFQLVEGTSVTHRDRFDKKF